MKVIWFVFLVLSVLVFGSLWLIVRAFYPGYYWESFLQVLSVPTALIVAVLLIAYFIIGWSGFVVYFFVLAGWLLLTIFCLIPIGVKVLTGQNMYIWFWNMGSWWEDRVPMSPLSVGIWFFGLFPAILLTIIEVSLIQLWL
jgi:hypothetical protein